MTIESTRTGALTRGQTVFMVAALVSSVASFMLNATMLRVAVDRGDHPELILKPRTAESGLSH